MDTTTTSPNQTFPQGSESKNGRIPALAPVIPFQPLLTPHEEAWLLCGRLRTHARRLERLAADAISKSYSTSLESVGIFNTTPGE